MHIVLWEFHVQPGKEAEFERVYGPDGEWVQLLRQAPGYLGTELWHEHDRPTVYLNVDRWKSVAHRQRFRTERKADYDTLDKRCQALTAKEIHIGNYTFDEIHHQEVGSVAVSAAPPPSASPGPSPAPAAGATPKA